MANAAIEGEDGNGHTAAHNPFVWADTLAGWFSGGGAAQICCCCAAIGFASGDEGARVRYVSSVPANK